MCREVEVMEDDLLALDTQLPHAAWGWAADEPGGWVLGGMPSPSHTLQGPSRLPWALPASQVRLGQCYR